MKAVAWKILISLKILLVIWREQIALVNIQHAVDYIRDVGPNFLKPNFYSISRSFDYPLYMETKNTGR